MRHAHQGWPPEPLNWFPEFSPRPKYCRTWPSPASAPLTPSFRARQAGRRRNTPRARPTHEPTASTRTEGLPAEAETDGWDPWLCASSSTSPARDQHGDKKKRREKFQAVAPLLPNPCSCLVALRRTTKTRSQVRREANSGVFSALATLLCRIPSPCSPQTNKLSHRARP